MAGPADGFVSVENDPKRTLTGPFQTTRADWVRCLFLGTAMSSDGAPFGKI
jgi:hypothetical protein